MSARSVEKRTQKRWMSALERINTMVTLEHDADKIESLVNPNDFVVFIGSGLSAGLYPTWHELIKKLCERCGVSPPTHDDVDQFQKKADEAKEKNTDAYCKVLGEIFGRPITKTNPAYSCLKRLKFKAYITHNFDRLLARAIKEDGKKIYAFPDLNQEHIGSECAYYVHGMISEGVAQNGKEIVLGSKDFDAEYDTTSTLYTFLHDVLIYQNILFIGCDLKEPQLTRVFEICNRVREKLKRGATRSPPNRYILRPYIYEEDKCNTGGVKKSEQKQFEENERFAEHQITIIRYESVDASYSGLQQILDRWLKVPKIESEPMWS